MLTFISFWRAAAIVLSDLASSAYYAGGDAEKVIGKSAAWFILAVMLFSYAVRALYIESSAMFVRGGVYRVVKEAMGSTLAKFSVSALLFDYVLTGPISAVSAGQYLAGFMEDIGTYLHHPIRFNENYFSAVFAILVVVYFWWKNVQGIHESSEKALQIMIVTTVMVVMLLLWCTITVFKVGVHWPPNPFHPGVIPLNKDSLGWLNGTFFSHLTLVIMFVGFGHSVLAMSGEETLAQVNREIEHPKLKNLEKTGLVIFIYSLLFTSLVSFFAYMIIPDHIRPNFFANLIGGIAMYLVGPMPLKLLFHGFVVLVGVLILAGAQNTTVQNSFLSGLSEVGDPFSDYNGNTLQGNTISGSVSLAAQHPWQFPTEVVGNTFVGLGRLDIASLSTDPTFVDVHGNTFTGGGSHYVAIRVEMGDRDVSIHDNTMNLQPGAFTVGIYVTDSQFVHIDNNHIKLAGDSTSIGIMIESYSFDPNVVFPCDVSITNNSQIDTGGKGTGLQFYLHKQDTTDTQPFLQAFVQQNNFNHNAIGVGVEGYGPEAGHIDLGGGALGSSGGNDFSGFTDADTANGHFAIALHNTVAGYILWANNNLFNLAWDPGVLKDSINNTDATEADYYSATEVGTGVIDIGTPPPNNSGGGTGGGDGSGGGGSYDPNGYGGYVNRKPAAQ